MPQTPTLPPPPPPVPEVLALKDFPSFPPMHARLTTPPWATLQTAILGDLCLAAAPPTSPGRGGSRSVNHMSYERCTCKQKTYTYAW